MRNVVGYLGLLLAMTFVGWCLRPTDSEEAAPVTASDPTVFEAIALEAVGLPLYPNAEPTGRATRQTAADRESTQAVLQTSDPLRDVAVFYRRALPGAERHLLGDGVLFTRDVGETSETVHLDPHPDRVVILLQRRAGREAGGGASADGH